MTPAQRDYLKKEVDRRVRIQRPYFIERRELAHEGDCPVCGDPLNTGSTNRPRVYCSDLCRKKAKRQRDRMAA